MQPQTDSINKTIFIPFNLSCFLLPLLLLELKNKFNECIDSDDAILSGNSSVAVATVSAPLSLFVSLVTWDKSACQQWAWTSLQWSCFHGNYSTVPVAVARWLFPWCSCFLISIATQADHYGVKALCWQIFDFLSFVSWSEIFNMYTMMMRRSRWQFNSL